MPPLARPAAPRRHSSAEPAGGLGPDRTTPSMSSKSQNPRHVPELRYPSGTVACPARPSLSCRGAAALMAHDLAAASVSRIFQVPAFTNCHLLANFGLFATPERGPGLRPRRLGRERFRRPGSRSLRALRPGASCVCGRENGLAGQSLRGGSASAGAVVSGGPICRSMPQMRVLDVSYARLDEETLIEADTDARGPHNAPHASRLRRTRRWVKYPCFQRSAHVKDGLPRVVG